MDTGYFLILAASVTNWYNGYGMCVTPETLQQVYGHTGTSVTVRVS